MLYTTSPIAIGIFLFFVAVVLGLSFYLGRRARSSRGYYAAHGGIHWAVNGVAFAGDYLSAASFLGICGMIAFSGYDGFLYSIGFLAGWIVALFVIAEPIKRLGKFTFADALDSAFDSPGIKLTAAISTLVVSIFYLIPQMVGAGALVTPLLGLPHWSGVLIVGVTVTLIVVTAGMVSTTWVQFIKGSLLVIFCFVLVVMILNRGLSVAPAAPLPPGTTAAEHVPAGSRLIAPSGEWKAKPYVRIQTPTDRVLTYRAVASAPKDFVGKLPVDMAQWTPADWNQLALAQTVSSKDGQTLVNGLPQSPENDLHSVGTISALPGDKSSTGPLSPTAFLTTLGDSTIVTWPKEAIEDADGHITTVYYQSPRKGSDLLTPGASAKFAGVRSNDLSKKLNFLSLMLALFCGTAGLPHILIRYYTVKDQDSARKSTIVGIGAIGVFYVLTLILGLGAMTSGALDPTDANMAAPLLARSFSNTLFAVISAIAFTTVLGTVSGLIMAGAGAVAHDLMANLFRVKMDDHKQVLYGKFAAIALGILAMVLGILFKNFNVAFLVGWAFNIAASANLPALVMLLFWRRTTAKGIAAAITVGLVSSLAWILLSADCYKDVYHIDPKLSFIPFSQPALVTVPLGFLTLVVVSLMTAGRGEPRRGEGRGTRDE
ncbi:MAG TPA: cation acetate symporter [Pirellulales bacterium]|jgi:cation/acetate symporter|nr:cation acetate symporter [Pirellulales bacterium]